MYLDDQPKPDWEMMPKTRRRFSLGVLVVIVVVLLLNLLGTPGPSMWDHQQPFSRDIVASSSSNLNR